MTEAGPRRWRQGAHRWPIGNYIWELWKQPSYYMFGFFFEVSLFADHQTLWLTLGRWVVYIHTKSAYNK